MCNLPTDEEYLDQLYRMLKDDEWMEMRERAGQNQDPAAMARQAISEGTFTHDQFDALVEALRESGSPELYFRGQFIGRLRTMALSMLEPYRKQLENVPVGCLPTRQLNAGAYLTPRDGAVILLDSGVILHLGLLVRSFIAYYTWNAPDHFAAGEPYCHDHSREAFAHTIQHLAAFCVSGNIEHLRKITTLSCPSLGTIDQTVEMFATGIEVFIMLHEYGHIALGHMSGCSVRPIHMGPAGDLTLWANSRLQEFEADRFAFNRYCSSGIRPADIAFAAGLLFHFFHLCELIRPPQNPTHPPGLARWQQIQNLASASLSTHLDSWANYLDRAFEPVSEGLPHL